MKPFLQLAVASGIDISGKNIRLPAAIVREFHHIEATDSLSIEFKSTTPIEGPDGSPLVCAIEVHEEPVQKSN